MKRAAASVALLLVLTACGGDGSPTVEEGTGDTTVEAADTTAPEPTTTATTVEPEPLTILVSNDDGYQAAGIGELVDALAEQPGVELVVVAPDGNRSGSGGQTSPDGFTATDVTMPNGHPAVAVSGFPADAVGHGLDALGVEADIVISGTNEGQNLGPLIDVSGTVGAARVAAQRGIPAVAVSTGFGTPEPDHAAAVDALIEWFVEHRDDLEGATQDQVVNINVPTCAVGEVRDLVDVASSTIEPGPESVTADVDCSGTDAAPADDVAAFNVGFAVVTLIAATPA